jgi:hypothetical protein
MDAAEDWGVLGLLKCTSSGETHPLEACGFAKYLGEGKGGIYDPPTEPDGLTLPLIDTLEGFSRSGDVLTKAD